MIRVFLLLLLTLNSFQSVAAGGFLQELINARETQSKTIEEVSRGEDFYQTHALVLFYASTCPHCHSLAPVLKEWAEKERMQVVLLSFDNKPLEGFLEFYPATTEWINAAFQGQAITYPALFILNQDSKALYPVSIGSMSASQLNARFDELIPKIKIYEEERS